MSETKILKLFKHNEPLETNQKQFDINLALNQNWDKIEEFADMVNDKVIELEDKNKEQDFKLQEQNTKLESQIKKDRENMINLETEGQSIHVEDSSDLEGQLEVLGNVEQDVTENSPSPEYPSEIRAVGDNINLFDKDNANILNAYIGTSNGRIAPGSYHRTIYLKVDKGTYTVTKHKGKEGLLLGYTNTEPKYEDIVENFINITNKNTATITIEDGYLVAYIFTTGDYNANQIPADILEGLKIEKGEVSTSYSPYGQGSVGMKMTSADNKEQTYILPIQKPMLEEDYFVKETDGWKEVHNCKLYKFTGNESFEKKGPYNEFNVFAITQNLPFEYKLQEYEKSGISNVFKTGKSISYVSNSTIQEGIQLYYNPSNELKAFYLSTKEFETVEELKAKIKEIDFKFYYILEVPEKVPCTTEQTEVLDQLDNLATYKPVTSITTDSIANLKLKYIADTKNYVDNKYNGLAQQIINQIAGGN